MASRDWELNQKVRHFTIMLFTGTPTKQEWSDFYHTRAEQSNRMRRAIRPRKRYRRCGR